MALVVRIFFLSFVDVGCGEQFLLFLKFYAC